MAEGSWVEVDVPRAEAAALALEGLRNVLAEQIPVIVAAISELQAGGADVPWPGIVQLLAQEAPGDAARMRAAADLAARMQRLTPGAVSPACAMVQVEAGWDGAGLNVAAARADAATLAQAVAGPGMDRALITEVARDVADHQGDQRYLAAFWSDPGAPAAAAGLAGALNRQDGKGTQLLSARDQHLLATFAASLAATVSQPGLLSDHASQHLVSAFAAPHDLWSAAMLFKYGPAGTAYGTTADGTGPGLLAGLTEALLTARAHQGYQVPGYKTQPGAYIPAQTYSGVLKILSDYGPLTAVMRRATQNGTAATQVLNGYDPVTGKTSQRQGTAWAHQLMDPPKVSFATQMESMYRGTTAITVKVQHPEPVIGGSAYPPSRGPMDGGIFSYIQTPDSTRAAFLCAATADHSSKASAQAVLNILAANAQINPSTTVLAKPIRDAFFLIAAGRVPDFALIAGGADQNTRAGTEPLNGAWLAITSQRELGLFLRQALADPVDAGRYLGLVEGKMSLAVQMQIATSRQWVTMTGALAGMTQQTINEINFNGAEKTAAFKARVQEFASLMLPLVLMVPTPTPQVGSIMADLAKPIIFGPVAGKLGVLEASTVVSDNVVAGGDPAKALELGDQAFIDDKTAAHLAVVKGLVDAGVLTPEPSFYRDGHVIDSPYVPVLMASGTKYHGMTMHQWVQQAVNGMELHQ